MPPSTRDWPASVWAFSAFSLLTGLYSVASSRVASHPLLLITSVVLELLWLAAIVVWRQQWAWWLWLLVDLIGLARGPFAGIAPYLMTIVTLALLVSPGVRDHVGIRLPFRRPSG